MFHVSENTQRYINVNKVHDELGDKMCRSLAGLHAMTRCDYTPAFYRKGKKKPFQILLANEEYQDAFINMKNVRKALVCRRNSFADTFFSI